MTEPSLVHLLENMHDDDDDQLIGIPSILLATFRNYDSSLDTVIDILNSRVQKRNNKRQELGLKSKKYYYELKLIQDQQQDQDQDQHEEQDQDQVQIHLVIDSGAWSYDKKHGDGSWMRETRGY